MCWRGARCTGPGFSIDPEAWDDSTRHGVTSAIALRKERLAFRASTEGGPDKLRVSDDPWNFSPSHSPSPDGTLLLGPVAAVAAERMLLLYLQQRKGGVGGGAVRGCGVL